MRARARISLFATSDGGLPEAMPSPCQSLLLGVDGDAPHTDDLFLGMQITAPLHETLEPGAHSLFVDLHLLSALADKYLWPGATFTLRYPIRVVGHGQVLEVLST